MKRDGNLSLYIARKDMEYMSLLAKGVIIVMHVHGETIIFNLRELLVMEICFIIPVSTITNYDCINR